MKFNRVFTNMLKEEPRTSEGGDWENGSDWKKFWETARKFWFLCQKVKNEWKWDARIKTNSHGPFGELSKNMQSALHDIFFSGEYTFKTDGPPHCNGTHRSGEDKIERIIDKETSSDPKLEKEYLKKLIKVLNDTMDRIHGE